LFERKTADSQKCGQKRLRWSRTRLLRIIVLYGDTKMAKKKAKKKATKKKATKKKATRKKKK
jgi:hypothetical protein